MSYVKKRTGSHKAARRLSVALLLGVIASLGCAGPRMMWLTEKRYSPRSASHPIDLYEGEVQTAHEEIAIIDSVAVELLTTETRKTLVEDLRARAREVGADAVMNVSMLTRADRGWIPDPQTPFRSWRQGWTDLHFLRGRAIRFRPLLVESGGGAVVGEPFDWAEGEQPTRQAETKPDLEIYEVKDRFGRRGYASRPVKPKRPTIETGN